jgi:hypothetical protein
MIFNDYYDCTYDELVTYYPTFYNEVKEMQAVLKAEGDLIDDVKSGIETVFGDCFIDSADEKTIAKLETFLHIHMHGERSLDDRRRLVKSYFVGSGKLSASLLSDIIGTYTGAKSQCRFEPCDIEGNNALYIDTERGAESNFYASDIMALVRAKLPAHIAYQLNVVYENECTVQNEIVFGYPVVANCGQHLCGQGVTEL